MEATLIVSAAGGVLTAVLAEVPIVGLVAAPVFGVIWTELTKTPEAGDVTQQLVSLIDSVQKYVDQKLQSAKEKTVKDAMSFFTAQAKDLQVQVRGLPESARLVIDTHHECVNKAREALFVSYDREWGEITLHNYALMASLYLALLDDGIKDKQNWGISQALKDTYIDRRARFFAAKEFSDLLGYSMDKAGQGVKPVRKLATKTTEITRFWYCFDPEIYPYGVPEIIGPLAASDAVPSNKSNHVYIQPSKEKATIVVNNMPGGYVRQILAHKGENWHPYYTDRSEGLLKLRAPDDSYPKKVKIRYYRVAEASTSVFIGLDYSLKISLTNGINIETQIPGHGAWKDRPLFQTEAVLLSPDNKGQVPNIFNRGQANAARLEYLELGSFTIEEPELVQVEWKPTGREARVLVYTSAVELLFCES